MRAPCWAPAARAAAAPAGTDRPPSPKVEPASRRAPPGGRFRFRRIGPQFRSIFASGSRRIVHPARAAGPPAGASSPRQPEETRDGDRAGCHLRRGRERPRVVRFPDPRPERIDRGSLPQPRPRRRPHRGGHADGAGRAHPRASAPAGDGDLPGAGGRLRERRAGVRAGRLLRRPPRGRARAARDARRMRDRPSCNRPRWTPPTSSSPSRRRSRR